MSSKRILVIAMSFLVVLFASFGSAQTTKTKKTTAKKSSKAAAATSNEEKAPRLTIVEPVKEYGTVPKGEKLDWAFLVKNTGDADLQIIAARPGCGCTVADFDKVIKPGETGKVTAHVDTTAFAGPISKTVTLETNDPSTPTSMLTIHAVVQPFVDAYPAGYVRFQLLQGDTDTQSIVLYSDESEPFEIKDIEVPDGGKWLKVTTEKVTNVAERVPGSNPNQNQYKLNIVAGGPDAKLGVIADKIHIITNSKHQPDFWVSVNGVVRPTFRVEPTVLNFGEVAPTDAAATRSVLLHSNDLKAPERFSVTKVESSTPAITTSYKAGVQKGDYEVTLQVAKNAKPGDIDSTVKIYTTDTVNPVVTLPVKATVKGAPAAGTSSSK
jgi:uncharacterized protein DUF1573